MAKDKKTARPEDIAREKVYAQVAKAIGGIVERDKQGLRIYEGDHVVVVRPIVKKGKLEDVIGAYTDGVYTPHAQEKEDE